MTPQSTGTTTAKVAESTPFSFPVVEGENGQYAASSLFEAPVKAAIHDENTTQKLITVTEDKAFICLARHLKNIGKQRWVQPLSLLLTMLLALATSEFDKLAWVSPALLTALFIVSSFVMLGWLIYEIMHAGKLKQLSEVIDDIFEELRGQRDEESPGAQLHVDLRQSLFTRVAK